MKWNVYEFLATIFILDVIQGHDPDIPRIILGLSIGAYHRKCDALICVLQRYSIFLDTVVILVEILVGNRVASVYDKIKFLDEVA